MRFSDAFIAIALAFGGAPAHAAIPVSDAAQLTERAEQASTTVKLLPITTKRQAANRSVNCAVTTGKKADVQNPTVEPRNGAGARAIQPYAPNQPTTADPSARGANLSRQTLFQSAGDIVAGVDANRSTTAAAQTSFQTASRQAGSAETVMGALDMNSAARVQNNLSLNSVISSANLWASALNARNLAVTGDTSRAASSMRAPTPQTSTIPRPICPIGMIGSGTAGDPCRTASTCQTTPPGTTPDPTCVSARVTDSDGNVLFYLTGFQNAARAIAGDGTARDNR